MYIYTYCSYKSSRYGYQYGVFSSKSTGIIKSILSSENPKSEILKDFTDWCENKSGWQLVVKRVEENYLVMVGQLEKSRELKKERMKSINKDNKFIDKKFNTNNLDSDFYMTLGFYGKISEIKSLSIYLLNEYANDGFYKLFNTLEDTISKSSDASRYEINATKFNKIFSNLKKIQTLESKESKSLKDYLINSIIRKLKVYPDIRLSIEKAKKNQERPSDRESNVRECSKVLSTMETFSESILLLIAYSYFSIDEKVNIHIDYEYLLSKIRCRCV